MWPLLVAVLTACTVGDDDPPESAPRRSVPVTAAALVAIAEDRTGARATDAQVGRIRPPECPDTYRRITAQASFDAKDIGLDLTLGDCPGAKYSVFECDGFPAHPGRDGVPLEDCFGRKLEDGGTLVAGRHHVYQESTSLLAVVTRDDYGYVVGGSADAPTGFTLEELAEIATDPAVGADVDSAYVDRGRSMTASG